jgi:uncharacterized cupin superfamily protein
LEGQVLLISNNDNIVEGTPNGNVVIELGFTGICGNLKLVGKMYVIDLRNRGDGGTE